MYGNDNIKKASLDIWKWCSYYTDNEDVVFSNYDGLFNPLEVHAYAYEYEQVKSIIECYTNKETKKKVKKSLKKVKEDLRLTNELNMDYYDLVCEFIDKEKKLYDSRDDIKKTI